MPRPSVASLLRSELCTVRTAVHSRAAQGMRFRACESSRQGATSYASPRRESTAGGLTQRKAGQSRWVREGERELSLASLKTAPPHARPKADLSDPHQRFSRTPWAVLYQGTQPLSGHQLHGSEVNDRTHKYKIPNVSLRVTCLAARILVFPELLAH